MGLEAVFFGSFRCFPATISDKEGAKEPKSESVELESESVSVVMSAMVRFFRSSVALVDDVAISVAFRLSFAVVVLSEVPKPCGRRTPMRFSNAVNFGLRVWDVERSMRGSGMRRPLAPWAGRDSMVSMGRLVLGIGRSGVMVDARGLGRSEDDCSGIIC
jgi:hypothetical protein